MFSPQRHREIPLCHLCLCGSFFLRLALRERLFELIERRTFLERLFAIVRLGRLIEWLLAIKRLRRFLVRRLAAIVWFGAPIERLLIAIEWLRRSRSVITPETRAGSAAEFRTIRGRL